MANKKNVEANKKNTEIKNKKSNKLEQKKPTQKKKRRLHSHLKVNIPLFQSLMMILPSLAKHAAAESIDNSSDAADQVTANNVTEKDVTDDHSKADSSAVALQEAQTSDSDVNSTLSASHAAHGSSSHLVPSHHLSTLSHPQVHYIPSVSMPTISSGSNGQPTHSNAPTTPALPVTFMPEVIKGTYGELHVDANGQYTFVLNPNSPQYILLNQHQPGTDHFALHLSNGSSIIVQIPVTGKQDTPNISGDLTGVVTEDHNIDSQGLLHANGKIDVIDPDQNESSVTPEVISGKYGSLTIDADGHWQYQVDNSLSNVQALTAATSLHESFTIHTKDGTPQTIDMTIGGNDDNAVITGVDAGTLTEDLTTQVQGQLSVTDSDLGEDHFQASQVTSNFGTLSITKDGAWTYSLDNNNPVVQRLGQGSTATDIVTVHSADGTAHQVMVTINGTNDHAVITSSTANSPSSFLAIGKSNGSSQVTEDKNLTVSGQLNITDIDSKEAHFSNSDLKGTLGTLHLKDNGDWSYDLDNKNPKVQALGQGSATTDIITIHSADGTPHQIAITVNGTNDKAVISGTSAGVVTEESQLQASGTLAVTDVDTGEAHFATSSTGSTDIAGSFGTLHLTDTGSWTYDLDNTNPNVQALGKGATATDTITVHSADGTPHQVTITVNGTNDKATVSSATVAIDETDKAVTTSGTLTSNDVDNPDNAFTPDSITGTNGNLTIGANGQWTFTASSAFNQLNVGDKVEETFTVSSVDGTASTIKVTINGTNDAATVSSATVAIDETDKAVTTSGTLTSIDVDNPDNAFTPDSISGTNGDLTIDTNGHWVFTANSAFNQLNVGDKVEETFTVSSVDGTPSTIKVTINGTNDAATVSSATVAIDETDKVVTTSGTLTSTDVDNPDNAFTPDSIAGTNGDLTIDANGHWVFTANSAFNQLNVGDKVEETFTVSSVDGTASTIKVAINGTNDAATVSTATVSVDETDKAVTTSGTLTSTDVDNPDNAFTPDSIRGTNGNLTIDTNGHWTFTANSAFNQLNVGDKVEETFTVSSVDGTASTIKVAINGTNDAATVSSASVAIDETDRAVTTSGTLTSIDVDNPDNAFTPDSISGTNGDLTIDANGHWVFTASSAFNQLNFGDKVEETFTVSSIDGTASTIKVTINGTNDAATVSTATVSVDETDKAVTTSGTLTSTDVDNPDNAFTPDSITGTNGDLTIDANGHWMFTANSAFNQLNVGDKVEETFTVSSVDGTPSTIKVTINGTNDAATVSSATVAIDETNKAVTASGTLTSTDVDNPDNTFTPDSISGTNGDLTIDANGHWVFTASSAFNQLNVGDKVEETFTVSSVDGTPSTIKVTINGTNDTATVSSATVAIDETDKAVTTSGTLTSTDVDNPDNTFTPDSISGTNGDLTIDANGHWMFTANSAFNQLNVGDKVEETFTVSSVDGTPSTIKVTINGTNDTATVSSATVAIDETDKAVTTSGTLTSTDVDNPDNTFAPDSISGTNGDLTIDANGHWVFTANSAFNQLNVGDKVEETFTVSSIDGTPSTIKVTINGTNDAATVSSATVAIDETDKAVTTSGTLTSTDVDNPDNAFTPDSIAGTNGDLNIDANGHWVFTANSAFNQLNVGDKIEETFTVSSIDGTASTIKVTINGTNDKATVSTATVSVDETDKAVTTSGTLTSTDVDNPDNAFTPDSISGTNGDLTIDANGHWVFTANSAFNQLNVGDKVEETFTVSSIDGTPSTIKVTINGTNDAATVSSATVAIDETDKAVTTSGTLTSTDVDNPDNAFTPDSISGTNGDLTIDANGHWVFTANSAFNQLNVGDKVEETFTVSSIDGTASTIKVTINGTNDAATVSTATVSVDETDKAVTTSGTLTSTDVDNPDNTFTPDSIVGANGDLTIDANGHWVFTANSAFNQLNVGDKVEETFTVSSIDGTTSTVKVTINGTNDAATVSSATVAIDETDKAVTTSGTLTSIDVDNPDNAFTPDSISGTNGDLTIDANGHWVFTANSAFNQLNVGDKVEETFTVSSVDGTPSTIKVTINGTNDAATVSSATVAIDETDKAVTTSGTLTSTDVDNPDNTFTPDSITGANGDLTIDANGHWTFTANSAFNQLNVGDKVEETFTVSSIDGTPSTIKVTINGTNDAATVSTATVSVDETDKAVTTSGTLTSTDVDNTDNTFTPDSIAGTNGDLTIDANGHWIFTANSAFNQLNVGDKVEETFTVSSIDGTPSTIKVTINGTNDAATVSTATVSVDETDKAVTTSGTLTSTDVDNPDNAFTPDSISGTNGDLIIDANGHWVFTASSAFNQLNVGDKVEETFTVSSVDGTPSTIKVTINGTNDTATVSSATVAIDETDKAVTTSGALTSTDVDNPDNAFTPDSITGTNGNLTIGANGQWTFTANSAFNQLNVGDKVEETFTVSSVDGTPSTVKVTINGTNDAATVSSATVAIDETDKAVTTSGTLTSTDVDNQDNAFTPDSITGTNGDLTIDANGHWAFTANSAFNQLNVGDKVEETFTVSSVDGTPSTIKVTINGTNDTATVSSATVAIDETDKAVTTSGTLTSTDVDNPDNTFTPDSISGTNGDLTIDANGHWVFTASSAFNQLNVGDKVEETFTVSSVDGTPSTIKVTINGTNDTATVSSATIAIDETDKAVTTSGALTSTDVDNPDNAFTPDSITGTNGNLTIGANGQWTFTANSAFNQLNVGDKVEETFTVSSVDGTPSTIKVTINGTNDRPTISGTSSGAVIEQGLNTAGNPDATGSLIATDIDKSDTVTWAINQPQGQWGTLSIDQHGHWHYQLDNSTGGAADKLAAGEHQSESFWITATDSTGATVPHKVVIDVQGSNDKPIVSAWTQLPAGKEDQPVTIKASDLLTHASDVDSSDVLHVTNLQATHGSLTDNKDGTYTFTPDKDFNGEIRLTYDVVDGHGGSVSTQAKFDLIATPDNAIITDAQANADLRGVTEDRGYIDTHYQLHYDGRLNIQDPDKGEAQFDPNIGSQTYQGIGYDTKLGGHILLMRDGHYTYTLDNRNIQNLAQGEVKHDSAIIRSADGTTHTIELTVHGTNDAPTINAQSHSVTEGGSVLNGQMVGQDIDTGAALTYSAPQIDGLVVNPDGSYSFDPAHSSYQSLASGVTKTLTVPVTVTDEHNASSTQNLSITITGVNNSAVIGGVYTGDVHEGHTYTAPDGTMSGGYVDDRSPDHMHGNIGKLWNDEIHTDGHLNIVDPDSGESHAQTGVYYGTHGRVILQSNGDWSYYASIGQDATGRKIDHLGQGESITDTVTVKSADGTTHDIVVTVHGDNDRPYCSGEVQLNNGKEDLAQTITATELIANTVDVDANDAGKLTIANLHADHGSIQDNHDGTFTFTPSHNYNGSVHFTYDVKDAHGGTTHTGASTTLSAVGDKAQIAGVDTGSITENSAGVDMSPDYAHSGIATLGNTTLYADGKLTITDPDVGESGFERQGSNGYDYHGTYGDLILLTDGTWHYHADAGHLSGIGARPTTRGTAIDQLGEGQSLTDTITVHSKDGTTHDIVITIHGSNDRPYCSSEVVLANGSEDTRQTLTTAQLLANTVDVDANDAGKLTIENLHVDHGSILNNADGTFTFTPEKDYNGDVHFSYDVKDAHGGVTHTGATTNLAAVNDNPDVTPLTDSVSEGADNHHTLNLLVGATDKDGDALTISHLEYAIDGQPQSGQLPTGITLDADGHTLIVDATDPAFNHLANGQSQQIAITYQVEDGHGGSTQQTATLTIAGTDDKATLVSNVIQLTETQALDSEFKFYRGQLQLIDPDSGDNTQFVFSGKYLGQGVEPGHLDVWPNGTYQFRLEAVTNRHADDLIGSLHAGESMELPYEIETNDGQKLTIMVKVTGEDNQAKIEVTPYSSLNNHVYEDHTSFGNTTNQLSSGGTLHVIDPDHDQAGFIAQTITTAEGGRFNINAKGHWSYDIDNDKVQHLGAGESFQQTFTVESIDGSAKKDITVTVHGTNDAPIASAEVRLANGLEDSKIVLTPALLLANTTDIDDNDIGKLSIENLHADHGSILINGDGTFTFTPEKDYNGDVHFSYDVKDAHGGVTHTGASTTLSAVGDAAIFAGDKSGQITEDRHVQGDAQHTIFVTGVLNVIDPDAGEDHFYDTRNAHAISDPYGGHLTIGKAGDWAYSVPNANIQHLAAGQVEQVQYEVTTAGGDKQIITINVHGTNDKPTVSEVIAGAHNIDEDVANATSGQIIISDVDHSDQHSVSIDSQHQPQYGSVTYNSNTQTWVYTLNNSNSHVNALNNGEQLTDKFSLLVDDGHGGITTQEVEMRIDGHSDVPPMPTLVAPAKITGSAGNQDLHASIGIPPIIHQGTPTPMTGWGISDHHGHSLTALHGQFGTLHVNPATGELSYDYQQTSSGVVKTHTGGSYGSGTDETDSFVLTLGGDQNSQVAVHLHLHSQSVHGNSGHHIDQTTLTGMDLSPIAPPPPPAPGMSQADEPDASFSTPDEVTLNFDEVTANLEHTAIGEHEQRSGAHAYLDALGINADSPSIDSPSHNVPVAHDIDIIFSDAESAYGAEQTDDGMSDGLSHHTDNPSIDDSLHHHNDVDGLPDIDPNN